MILNKILNFLLVFAKHCLKHYIKQKALLYKTKMEEHLRKSSTLKDNLKMSDLGEIVPESTVKKSNEMFT